MSEVSISLTTDRTGIWICGPDGFQRVGADLPSQPLLYVPTEDVALFAADLPLPTRAQRAAAAAFAIEDRLAEPLDQLHIALGGETTPRRHIIGAVRRERMADWIEMAEAAGLGRAAFVPDVFRLPAPAPGAWSVRIDEKRALVRQSDGTGFALPVDFLVSTWAAAGRPAVGLTHGVLPRGLDAEPAALHLGAADLRPPLDLRQGVFALKRPRASNLIRLLGGLVAAGVVAHVLIAAVDLVALRRIAARKHTEASALLQQASPGLAANADLLQQLDAVLPASGAANSGRFFPLLTQSSRALQPLGTAVSYKSLAYLDGDHSLQLKVEASDRAGLQAAQTALTATGLAVSQGASTVEPGRATGDLTLRQPGTVR